jgi:hypothetical protein
MQFFLDPRFKQFAAPLRRALLCLCSLLLALQLLGSSFHDHDLSEQLNDCVSCQLASQPALDLPAVDPQLLAVFLALAYFLARLPRPAVVVLRRYLIPARQAPPGSALPFV